MADQLYHHFIIYGTYDSAKYSTYTCCAFKDFPIIIMQAMQKCKHSNELFCIDAYTHTYSSCSYAGYIDENHTCMH